MQKPVYPDRHVFVRLSSNAEKIRFLVQYAHLAPSTHNIQPWLFEIQDSSCRIHYDPKLDLPNNDPLGRDRYISLGCCIENLVIAAGYYGVRTRVQYPLGPAELVAEVHFENLDAAAARDDQAPLLKAISERFNARGMFKKRSASRAFMQTLATLNDEYGPQVKVHAVEERSGIQELARLTAEGIVSAYHRPEFRREIAALIRPNYSKHKDGLPGYSLRMNMIMSMILPWAMKNFDIGKKLSQINYATISSAPLMCAYTAPANEPLMYLKVGRLAERVMLEANVHGMKTSIVVASVEIDDLYKDVQKVIGSTDIPQFVMAVGYIDTPQGNTPRQPLESRLK